jgi:predicted ATPase
MSDGPSSRTSNFTPRDSSSSPYYEERTSFSSDDGGPEWKLRSNDLFGRETESETIQELADERSTNVLVLHGTQGSGKSSLMERQPWEGRGWVLASGKYEEHRTKEPYSALIAALNGLVDRWAENNERAELCRLPSFRNLLEEDIQFLKNILPRAFDLVGACRATSIDKAAAAAVSPSPDFTGEGGVTGEGGEYVNAAFWRILSFLCESKPVVLFLDDIQWADQASLDAIRLMATTGNVQGLLLAMAYREEEFHEGDRVSACLSAIGEAGETVHKIAVPDLEVDNVNQLVASVLGLDPEQSRELSMVIHSKTAGNPFFVMQFLQFLRQERFLKYSLGSFQWTWGDLGKLDKLASVSDNVAKVVAANMSKLPTATLVSLKVASGLGKSIPLRVMIDFFDDSEVQSELLMLCDALKGIRLCGLKSVLDKAVIYGILTRSDDQEVYMWAHDKLQYVAYSMISTEFRPKIHLKLGKLLWKMSSENPDDEWMLYMAANQLNRFSEGREATLGEDVARLSLVAGKLSLSKSALYPALEMFLSAAKHVRVCENRWDKSYELCLDIFSSLGEVAGRLGNHEEAVGAVSEVLCHAKSLDDKFRAQLVLLRCHSHRNDRDYTKTVQSIQDFLHEYDVKFPQKLLPGQQYLESRKLKSRLGGSLDALLGLQRLDTGDETERRYQNVVVLLSQLGMYAWLVPNLRSLGHYAYTRALNTSIKHGVCAATTTALAGIALHLLESGHYQEAKEYGDFAIKLVDTFPPELGSAHAGVHGSVVFCILSSVLPFNNVLDPCLDVNRIALKTGDTEKASMSHIGYSFAYLCVGLPIAALDSDLASFGKESRQFGMPSTIQVLYAICRQTIRNLQTMESDPTLLKGEWFDQGKELRKFHGPGLAMTERDINTFRLMLACVYEEWETASHLVDSLERYLDTDKFVARAHLRLTYAGVACLILGRRNGKKNAHYRHLGRKIMKNFREDVRRGSQNAHPVLLMLEAIETPSKERFDLAIRTCARLGLIQHEALLYELAGLSSLRQGDEGWAEYYLAQAHNLYGEWGATGKAKQLQNDHKELLSMSSLSLSARGSVLKGRSRYDPENVAQMSHVELSTSNSISRASLSATASSFAGSKNGFTI